MTILTTVRARKIAGLAAAAVATTWAALLGAPAPSAAAQPCPDVEVVFARGTSEPPGVGGVGQSFIDSLRTQLGARSVAVYPVNYPASSDFANRLGLARTVVDGIRDAATHVEATAANCPNTRIVLGGYSQGAVVAGFVTSAVVPDGVPQEYASYIPQPMPPEVADHVAAVALFAKPSDQFMREIGAPPVVIGPGYAAKTIELCEAGDTICSGAPGGGPNIAHILYNANGMTGNAAGFVAGRI